MLLPRRARAAKLGKPAMKFLPLLGKLLKDDEVVAVLEQADMEVIYDFDRLHENTPDKYWAESKKHGYNCGLTLIRSSTLFFYTLRPLTVSRR